MVNYQRVIYKALQSRYPITYSSSEMEPSMGSQFTSARDVIELMNDEDEEWWLRDKDTSSADIMEYLNRKRLWWLICSYI